MNMFPKPYDLKNKSVNKYLIKIGEVIILMGFLESWIDFWIWHLIAARGNANEGQEIGKKITSGIMYRQKTDLLLGLIQSRASTKINSFKKLHKKLQALGDKRNVLVHSQWFIMYGNKKEHIKRDTKILSLRHGVSKKDGSLDFSKSYSDLKISDLTKIILNIRKLHNDLTKFTLDL